MKDKPIKQPWPRSAKITVWVLGIIIAVSAIVNIITITQWYEVYEKWNDFSTRYLPAEEPKEEDIPDLHEMDFEYPVLEPKSELEAGADIPSRFPGNPLFGMSPELEKKIFVYGPERSMIAETFRRRELPNGEYIQILPNGQMLYNGSLLTKEGADLLEAWMRAR